MLNILMLISSFSISLIRTRDIYMNFSYLANDFIENIAIGGTKWNSNTNYSYNSIDSFPFKGEIGQRFEFDLVNKMGEWATVGGILTVGTTEFFSDYWTSDKKFELEESVSVCGKIIKPIAFKNLNNAKLSFKIKIFIPPLTYCSNYLTVNLSPPNKYGPPEMTVYYANKGYFRPLDFEEMVYPAPNFAPSFQIISGLIAVEITQNDNYVSLNVPASLTRLKIKGLSYGQEELIYEAISNNIASQPCKLTIIVCHEFCRTCKPNLPSQVHHQCLSCIDSFQLRNGNCESNCQSPWILHSIDNVECVNQCPASLPFKIDATNQCVETCPATDPFIYESQCYPACPGNSQPYNYQCYAKCFAGSGSSQSIVISQTYTDCKDVIKELILYYQQLQKTVIYTDFSVQVYLSSFPPLASKNESLIDLTECLGQLKKVNSIQPEAPLIIAKFTLFAANTTKYDVYNIKGNMLNLAYCKRLKSTILQPIADSGDLLKLNRLKEIGVDPFNPNQLFYSDSCYSFSYSDYDVIPADRREEFFYDASLCGSHCTFIAIEDAKVKCSCPIVSLSKETANPANNSFNINSTESNFQVSKCYSLLFSLDNLQSSAGFWASMVFCAMFLLSLIKYFSNGTQMFNPAINSYSNIYDKLLQFPSFVPALENNPQGTVSEQNQQQLKHSNSLTLTEDECFDKLLKIASDNSEKKTLFSFFLKYATSYVCIRSSSPNSSFIILKLAIIPMNAALLLGLTALLFSNEMISEIYHSKETNYSQICLNSVYSCLICFGFSALIRQLISIENKIIGLIHFSQNKENFLANAHGLLGKCKVPIAIFFIVGTIIMLFCGYFATLFSVVYVKTQGVWMINWAISVAFSFGFFLLLCFVKAKLMHSSLASKSVSSFKTALSLSQRL